MLESRHADAGAPDSRDMVRGENPFALEMWRRSNVGVVGVWCDDEGGEGAAWVGVTTCPVMAASTPGRNGGARRNEEAE
jgi:hypothetical protein